MVTCRVIVLRVTMHIQYVGRIHVLKGWSTEKKICYMGHKRFLPQPHRFRKQKKDFNREAEHVRAPKPLSGAEVLYSLLVVEVVFGKGRRPSNTESVWKK